MRKYRKYKGETRQSNKEECYTKKPRGKTGKASSIHKCQQKHDLPDVPVLYMFYIILCYFLLTIPLKATIYIYPHDDKYSQDGLKWKYENYYTKSTAKNHKDLFYNNLHGLGYFVSESLRSFNRSSDNMLLRVTIHVTEGLNLLVFAEQQNIIYLMGYLFLKQWLCLTISGSN